MTGLFILTTGLLSCGQAGDCPENINAIPLFGSQKKCDEQIKADIIFIEECNKFYKNRKYAVQHHLEMGWNYFYENKFDSAIMRFNQAWLLDSTNADLYWGLGSVLGKMQKFDESISFFEKSILLNPNNSKVFEGASTSYGQLFFKSKDVNQLNQCIEYLKNSVQLDQTNARAYAQLTAAYSYFMQKDSAKKYLEITDKLDPNAVNPEVRQSLLQK